MKSVFFPSPADFRRWLEEHHDEADELWVGFYKKATGKPSITWPASVDQALCFGWIDGLRKSIDAESYKIRFTPRRARSHWSAVNIGRVAELTEMGLMQPPGIEAFKRLDEKNSERAFYEQKKVELDPAFKAEFRKNESAWAFFQAQAPSYRKLATWWVMSAKQEATRLRRLSILMKSSEAGEKIPPLRWGKK
jgi:uncharacterized protein YdeI (YjbR/CyaY-like superfamily)